MRARSAIIWIVLASLYCLSGGLFVAYLAQDLYPDYAGPIVLAGVLVLALPLSLFFTRILIRGSREEFATKFGKSKRAFCLACLVVSVGALLGGSERDVFSIIGIIVSACGVVATAWLFLKAIPAARHDTSDELSKNCNE